MNGHQWSKHAVLATLILTSICCAVLTLQVLCKESNKKAGIATLHFNLTGIKILDRHVAVINSLPERDIIESVHNGVKSAANGITTAVPGAVSQVQSAASTAATGALDAIKAAIPRNCSIGTTQFCVGLAYNISCNNLPLNLSNIIPTDVEKVFQVKLNDIRAMNGALAKVSAANIQDCLIAGLILMLVMVMFGRFFRLGIHLVFGLFCCIPFFVAVIVLYVLKSKIQQLPPWIQVEQGEVGKLCLGGLCCAISMILLSSTISAIF